MTDAGNVRRNLLLAHNYEIVVARSVCGQKVAPEVGVRFQIGMYSRFASCVDEFYQTGIFTQSHRLRAGILS